MKNALLTLFGWRLDPETGCYPCGCYRHSSVGYAIEWRFPRLTNYVVNLYNALLGRN